jgi:hypothetical protein
VLNDHNKISGEIAAKLGEKMKAKKDSSNSQSKVFDKVEA